MPKARCELEKMKEVPPNTDIAASDALTSTISCTEAAQSQKQKPGILDNTIQAVTQETTGTVQLASSKKCCS